MQNDPIVDEIHKVRAKRLAECDGSLDKYMDRLLRAETEEEHPLIKSAAELKSRTKAAPAA